jgi:hypothetical protein
MGSCQAGLTWVTTQRNIRQRQSSYTATLPFFICHQNYPIMPIVNIKNLPEQQQSTEPRPLDRFLITVIL